MYQSIRLWIESISEVVARKHFLVKLIRPNSNAEVRL
jgi:hypothetical protein